MPFHRQLPKPKSFLGFNMFVETRILGVTAQIFYIDSTQS